MDVYSIPSFRIDLSARSWNAKYQGSASTVFSGSWLVTVIDFYKKWYTEFTVQSTLGLLVIGLLCGLPDYNRLIDLFNQAQASLEDGIGYCEPGHSRCCVLFYLFITCLTD